MAAMSCMTCGTDPGEQTDLAAQQADRTSDMAQRLKTWLTQVGARYPTANPNYNAQQAERQAEQIRTKGIQNLERQAAGFLREDYVAPKNWWGSNVND